MAFPSQRGYCPIFIIKRGIRFDKAKNHLVSQQISCESLLCAKHNSRSLYTTIKEKTFTALTELTF